MEQVVKEFTYRNHGIKIIDRGSESDRTDFDFCYEIAGLGIFIAYEDAEEAEKNAKAHVDSLFEFGLVERQYLESTTGD